MNDRLEWYDRPGDEEESHVIAGGCPPGWWTARRDYGKMRRSEDWGLWLGGEQVARADSLDAAKALAQRLQDVLDGADVVWRNDD